MKTILLFLTLAASVAQTDSTQPPASPASPTTTPAPAAAPAASSTSTSDGAVPVAGFPASRYAALWTKSPFAVATSEETADTSPDYSLVGISNIDGVSYASLIDFASQQHFLISSDKPTRGLTLTSITRNGTDTFATVLKDGAPITLKLEEPPANLVPANAAAGNISPQPMAQQIPMPGANQSFGGGSVRPFPRFHRPLIHLPPPPGQPAPQTPAAANPVPPPPQ